MTWRLELRRAVEREIEGQYAYYEKQRIGLGNEFLQEVGATFASLRQTPEMHQVRYKDVRRAPVKRFPFGVFYRVLADRVMVIAVCHDRRDPKMWQRRRVRSRPYDASYLCQSEYSHAVPR